MFQIQIGISLHVEYEVYINIMMPFTYVENQQRGSKYSVSKHILQMMNANRKRNVVCTNNFVMWTASSQFFY